MTTAMLGQLVVISFLSFLLIQDRQSGKWKRINIGIPTGYRSGLFIRVPTE